MTKPRISSLPVITVLFTVLSLTVASSISALGQSPNDVPIIDLGYARYQGVFDDVNNLTSYLGIRYAAAPIGDLRWRAPQAPASNDSTVQQANIGPNPCFQATSGNASTNPFVRRDLAATDSPEDCLFLNVFFPGNDVPTKPLPTVSFNYLTVTRDSTSMSYLFPTEAFLDTWGRSSLETLGPPGHPDFPSKSWPSHTL
ncbi:hypothetical protein D9757_012937 [Collybiopsis confluens]|uniref:Carboxylesterase type B domain-containing protein n=1 Tax=Collybiopsis confluens TaxID=2823264 RepID=A0A8H5FYU4_9AGAR|nr:hypothetical protein D9757_012937 [Collybiopsis confluens]